MSGKTYDMNIRLSCGRNVRVRFFSLTDTYGGLLAGSPTRELNRQIIERAKAQAAQANESSPVHVIPPKTVMRTHAAVQFPVRCSAADDILVVRSRRIRYPELPAVTCTALLEDIGDSLLTVVWFRGDCSGKAIRTVIESAVRDLPWNELSETAGD